MASSSSSVMSTGGHSSSSSSAVAMAPPPGGDPTGSSSNDTVLRDLEASFYVWESLWQRNQQSAFVKYNLLDAVGMDTAEVKLWLFTSADGLVKSKARHRFNADSVAERCSGGNAFNHASSGTAGAGKLSGHYTTDGFDWKQLHRKEQVHAVVGRRSPAAIVSYGHIYGNLTWLEATYEVDELGIRRPKCTTFMLCGSKAMGTALSDDNTSIVPGEKIMSKNKALNECARKALYDLVHHVEMRRPGVQVRRLVAVYMCESEEDVLEGGAGDGSRVLWLHHAREVVTRGKRNGGKGGGGGGGSVAGSVADSYYSDLRSESSARRSLACSDILHNTSTFSRPTKCQGDFCRYSEQEEIMIMKTIGTKTSSVIAEARKAMRRHHGKSAVSTALDEVGEVLAEDDGETPLGADAGTFEAESIPPAGQARHVPYKSVALARHEMKDLEAAMNSNHVDFAGSPPQHPSAAAAQRDRDAGEGPNPVSFCNAEKIWPERLRHWWGRIGKSMAQRRIDAVPDSSASYSTVNIASAVLDKAHQKRLPKGRSVAQMHEAGDTSNKPKMVVHMPVGGSPLKRPHADDDDERSAGVSTIGASVASALSKAVPYDLTENSFGANKRKNLGEVSWYYSDARVCEKCYRVYQDLDKRRKHVENKLIELRRAATEETEHTAEKDRDRERREFEQRKFTSRISQVKLKPVEGTDNEYTTYVEHRTDVGIAGGHRKQRGGQSQGGRGVVGAPRGVLPPMPWQLKDGDKAQKYQQIGSSFIRNIGSKARDVATDAHHLRMMAELERVRHVGGGALLGSMTDDRLGAAGHDPEKEIERQWEQITRGAAQLRAASEGGNPLHRVLPKQQPRSFAAVDKALTTSEVKTFDRSRFMHSYQRDMEKMRAAMERGEDVDMAALDGTGAPSAAPGPRIVVVKKKTVGAGGAGKLKRAPRRGDDAGGDGMYYKFDDVSRLADRTDRGPLYPPPAQKKFVQLSQYAQAQRRGDDDEEDDDDDDGGGAGMGVEDPSSRVVNLLLRHPDTSAPSPAASSSSSSLPATLRTEMRKAKAAMRAAGGLDAASWVSDTSAGDRHHPAPDGRDRTQSGKRAVSFAPPTDTYKIPPVTGGLGNMYGHAAPSPAVGGGPAPAPAPAAKGGNLLGSNAYLVRLPANLAGAATAAADDDDDGEDDDDDDDEGIGWSPFVVPVSK